MQLPRARTLNIVVQDFDEEVLVYDLTTNKAFCLNRTSATVFQACDGKTTPEGLAKTYGYSIDLVELALEQLEKQGLLESRTLYQTAFAGIGRRDALKRVALGSAVALPFISSVIAPTALMAASCAASGQTCTQNNGTQSNCCSLSDRCTNTGTVACHACLGLGNNTNCNSGPGCCTTQIAFFSNSCCNGVTEAVTGTPGVFSCTCN